MVRVILKIGVKIGLLIFLFFTVRGVFAGTLQPPTQESVQDYCVSSLAKLPGETDPAALAALCKRAEVRFGCASVKGRPIFSIDRETPSPRAKRVLVFALIHGDEPQAGTLIRDWLLRLETISPRNNWRIIPILNPDGRAQNTRFNAHGVDLNRNFPSKDWADRALAYWRKVERANPRRFPGSAPASEPEVRCAMSYIEDYRPDLIVSVHAPYGLLDFDGPSIVFPSFSHLPWKDLGTYPGSLGRYMWANRRVPVLTVELRASMNRSNRNWYVELEDLAGTLAQRAAPIRPSF